MLRLRSDSFERALGMELLLIVTVLSNFYTGDLQEPDSVLLFLCLIFQITLKDIECEIAMKNPVVDGKLPKCI